MFVWDDPDERYFSTGIDRGGLYFYNPTTDADVAVPWNGLIGATESGSGSSTVLYRDGEIFHASVEPGDYSGTVDAYYWPSEFGICLGIPQVAPGLSLDNQRPLPFHFTYRTLVGNGTFGDMFGYEIHLFYNCVASVGTRTRKTKTDSPSLDEFSFDIVATPTSVPGYRPTAHAVIDTRGLDSETLQTIEEMLYSGGSMPPLRDMYETLKFGDSVTYIPIGYGRITVRASSSAMEVIDDHLNIFNATGADNGNGSYTLSDSL